MRTRFLTPDYFNTNETLKFLRFPLPSLQSPPNSLSSSSSTFDQELLRCSTDSSAISVSFQLQGFPIDNALEKFLSDVLPHTIDAQNGVSPFDFSHRSGCVQVPEEGADLAYVERATEKVETSNFDIKFTKERSKDASGGKRESGPVIIQFETPELSHYLENTSMSEKQKIQLLTGPEEFDNTMDLPNTGLPDLSFGHTKDSLETVEAICVDYDMEQKPKIPDEAFPLLKNIHPCDSQYPLLEVDEIGMEDSFWSCLEDELHAYIKSIEVQHCTDNKDFELSCQYLLGSADIDILKHVDGHHTSKLPLDFHPESLNMTLYIDILQIVEMCCSDEATGAMDAHIIPFPETYLFEEFVMLDSDPFEIFEAQFICEIIKEPETCGQLFHRDMNFKSFDELIISCELATIDGSFTSLPVPVLLDDEKTLSLHAIIDDVLSKLEPVPLSTSNEIYLDWQLLGKDKCNVSAAIEKVFNDIEDSTIDSDLKHDDGSMLVLDFLFIDDPLKRLNIREDKLDMPSAGSCKAKQRINRVISSRLSDDDCQIIENGGELINAGFEKVESGKLLDDDCQIIEVDGMLGGEIGKSVSSLESMSQFNDLDFFLNPMKATDSMKVDHEVKVLDAKPMHSGRLYKKETASPKSMQMQQSGIQLHTVRLPANITTLIDNLSRSYLAVFRADAQLNEAAILTNNANDTNLLGLSEEKLMDYMSRSTKRISFMGYADDNAVDYVTLCAIKRMAWCLCFYGIYTLHLLMRKFLQSLHCLESRLSFLHSVIKDAHMELDKDITKSHPSLAVIKEILQQNTSRKRKVLILAQQFLWEPLRRLLISMGISVTEVRDLSMDKSRSDLCYDFRDAGARDQLQTACLLSPNEHISSSILMQKFDLILEHGGPSGLSKVVTLYPEYIGPNLHFLKVELEGNAKALCEGVIVASTDRGTILEDLLNFGSVTDNCTLVSSKAAGRTSPRIRQESEPIQPNGLSFPDMIIIINTQDFDKNMIISRRSTYQKILNMEKRGGQVVERDLNLPVDLVVDATMCIAGYDSKNIGNKASNPDEGSSSIPLCIENIAANVLTSLSFTFTTCVLIFEGESNFLATVMESADELYAAAASLGINLQIFCSYSFELTDDIILSTIEHAMNFCRGLLPRLPESETFSESFLTKFPSINPLSAHAIISCGCSLLEFIERSVEGRISALRKYHVADESIDLLSILCKYGEREESKSGLTDCSSSVSSPPDSGNHVYKINSGDRKRKFVPSSSDAMHGFRCSEQSHKYIDEELNYRSMSRPLDVKVSKSPTIYPTDKLPVLLDEELFGRGDVPDTAPNTGASKPWSKQNITLAPEVFQMDDDFAQSTFPLNDRFFNQQKPGVAINGQQEYDGNILADLHDDFVGEVVDIHEKPLLHGAFQTADNPLNFSQFVCETNGHAPKYTKTAKRLSFDSSSYPNFRMTDETNTKRGLEDNRQLTVDDDYNVGYNWSNFRLHSQKEPIGMNLMEKSTQNFNAPFLKERGFSPYGETPLSKAINSGQLLQGSPWTIEFLNRMKEKRKLRQQRQPCDTSVPHSSSHGNINKATKRRSPSILEYYKYQGGSTPRKAVEQKRQKQDPRPLNDKPLGFLPTWTPTDKKAKRTLSFATNGTGRQTKLVWRDNNSCSQDSRFSN